MVAVARIFRPIPTTSLMHVLQFFDRHHHESVHIALYARLILSCMPVTLHVFPLRHHATFRRGRPVVFRQFLPRPALLPSQEGQQRHPHQLSNRWRRRRERTCIHRIAFFFVSVRFIVCRIFIPRIATSVIVVCSMRPCHVRSFLSEICFRTISTFVSRNFSIFHIFLFFFPKYVIFNELGSFAFGAFHEVTERLRLLTHISNYFQNFGNYEKNALR